MVVLYWLLLVFSTFFANNFREKSLLELRKEICFGSTNSSQCSEIDQKNYRVNGIATIMDKIFETNCSFHPRGALREKFNFCFSGSIANFLFWQKDWALGYNSMKFSDFPDISEFRKIPSLKLFGNSWDNLHIPSLLLRVTLRFTYGERKIWWNIKKSQNIMTMIVE